VSKKKRRAPATPTRPEQAAKQREQGRELLLGAGILGMLLAVVLGAALGLSALRDGDGGLLAERDPLAPTEDPGPIHVHGLGINPGDGSLFIATHTGLFRVEREKEQAERVGDKLQDTMGFTVVGADRFLGSGHPDPRDIRDRRLPPLLGLIESTNAGNTWRPISLLGQADFHVLRSVGKRIYGYDATNDRLLISRDAGRSWEQRRRPIPLIDLAADPRNPRRIVAVGEGGLYRSGDEGRSWELVRDDAAGLLAWPSEESLFLVDGRGGVFVSADRGRGWKAVGQIGGQPAALLGRTATELYVALHDGTIKRSGNGGRTWAVHSKPS
jgi:photosystem II stability/assembly factor-like uncharacterized protein